MARRAVTWPITPTKVSNPVKSPRSCATSLGWNWRSGCGAMNIKCLSPPTSTPAPIITTLSSTPWACGTAGNSTAANGPTISFASYRTIYAGNTSFPPSKIRKEKRPEAFTLLKRTANPPGTTSCGKPWTQPSRSAWTGTTCGKPSGSRVMSWIPTPPTNTPPYGGSAVKRRCDCTGCERATIFRPSVSGSRKTASGTPMTWAISDTSPSPFSGIAPNACG